MAITIPTTAQIKALVSPYLALNTQGIGLGIAIGCATANDNKFFFFGSVQDPFGNDMTLNAETSFEIASITKTFTATLYAANLQTLPASTTLQKFIQNGLLPISSTLQHIKISSLADYTSGLPQDNDSDSVDSPQPLPQPYAFNSMWRYLFNDPPSVTNTGAAYTYSNLAFSILSAVLADGAHLENFRAMTTNTLLVPLGIQAHFFDSSPMDNFPQGYVYNSSNTSPFSSAQSGWPLFPAYYGAGGLILSSNGMMSWLQYNMGLSSNTQLNNLLSSTQVNQSPNVTDPYGNSLGFGWFLTDGNLGNTIWKDGDLEGSNTYIILANSGTPGKSPSSAGVFVMINCSGMSEIDDADYPLASYLGDSILGLMLGSTAKPVKNAARPEFRRRKK